MKPVLLYNAMLLTLALIAPNSEAASNLTRSASGQIYTEMAQSSGCMQQLENLRSADLMTLGEKSGEALLSGVIFPNIQRIGTREQAFGLVAGRPLEWFRQASTREELKSAVDKYYKFLGDLQGPASGHLGGDIARARWKDFSIKALQFHACVTKSMFESFDLISEINSKIAAANKDQGNQSVERESLPDSFGAASAEDIFLACTFKNFPEDFEKGTLYFLFQNKAPDARGDRSGLVASYSSNGKIGVHGRFRWAGENKLPIESVAVFDDLNMYLSRSKKYISETHPLAPLQIEEIFYDAQPWDLIKYAREIRADRPIWDIKFHSGIKKGQVEGVIDQRSYSAQGKRVYKPILAQTYNLRCTRK